MTAAPPQAHHGTGERRAALWLRLCRSVVRGLRRTSRRPSAPSTRQGDQDGAAAAAPFTTLLQQTSKKATDDPKFEWFGDRPQAPVRRHQRRRWLHVGRHGADRRQRQLVRRARHRGRYPHGERIRVTQVVGNVLTVVRGTGTTSAAAINDDDDELMIVSSSQPEGDVSKTARSTKRRGRLQLHADLPHPVRGHGFGVRLGEGDEPALLGPPDREGRDGAQARPRARGSVRPAVGEHVRQRAPSHHGITTNVTDAGGAFTETEFNRPGDDGQRLVDNGEPGRRNDVEVVGGLRGLRIEVDG